MTVILRQRVLGFIDNSDKRRYRLHLHLHEDWAKCAVVKGAEKKGVPNISIFPEHLQVFVLPTD
jgi:hypothetical protein